MAYEHGTASGHIDLWNKLISFLTTNADLVAANEEWQIIWTDPSADQKNGIVLKGPGATGADSIFIGLRRRDRVAADEQEFHIWGMTGILPSAPTVTDHVNVSGGARVLLDSGNMEYWFVASGRRFVMVAKMSTVYEAMYGGFFLPYANPLSYPYPLFIGGSTPLMSDTEGNYRYPKNWRSQEHIHSHFHIAREATWNSLIEKRHRSAAWYLDTNAAWQLVTTSDKTEHSRTTMAPHTMYAGDENGNLNWPYEADSGNTPYRFNMLERMEENVGGGYALNQLTMIRELPSVETVGVLDGCYHVPGQNNAVENIVQVDGVDHLVIHNVFRTTVSEYWALRLS